MGIKSLTRSVTFVMVASLVLASCGYESDDMVPSLPDNVLQGKRIVLGRRLENPYSVANMERAKNELNSDDAPDIHTTHYYVRFKPSNFAEYDRLIADTTITFSDYPLDYDIAETGDYYHDPALADTVPTYQYASVPVDYVFPSDIDYDILEQLYLPESDKALLTNGRLSAAREELVERLEDKALALTNNLGQRDDASSARESTRGARWYPAGLIAVYDNRVNRFIPMEGVKVQARRWFKIVTAYTNSRGMYSMDKSFRYEVNYSIPWERNKFDIRSGTFGQARFNGPKQTGNWNLKIYQNGLSFHYAHVFRAAMRYNYGDIGGLRRPGFKIKYSVFDKSGNHLARNIGNWSAFSINPNILIYRYNPNDGTENDSDEMFSTTCHETAHATHMEVMNAGMIQFLQVSEQIRESWAVAVEWSLTQKEYKALGIPNYADANYNVEVNYPIKNAFQYWSKSRMPNITSLFIDIVDQNNQKGQTYDNNRYGTVNDPVSGYTLAQIESGMLKHVYGLGSLKDQLEAHRPAELGESQIRLFMENF